MRWLRRIENVGGRQEEGRDKRLRKVFRMRKVYDKSEVMSLRGSNKAKKSKMKEKEIA